MGSLPGGFPNQSDSPPTFNRHPSGTKALPSLPHFLAMRRTDQPLASRFRTAAAFALAAVSALAGPVRAQEAETGAPAESESLAEATLKQLVRRERETIGRYETSVTKEDISRIEAELQSVVDGYEKLLAAAPQFAAGYVAYGMLLQRLDQREAALGAFLKADEIDPNIAVAKNQLGNYFAEEGQFVEAMGFYLMAIELEPQEPLYHYQLGNLLHEYREAFVAEGLYQPETIDLKTQEAFREAVRLDPDALPYRFRYAQSFFDVARPNWKLALEEWTRLGELAQDDFERQVVDLHLARARYELGQDAIAKDLVEGVDHPALQEARSNLVASYEAGGAPAAGEDLPNLSAPSPSGVSSR